MRREGVADNIHGGLRVAVRCDVVGVAACDYDGGLWKASFIGLVRRGMTGRGRFTNRPYRGVIGLSDGCASVSIGHGMMNGQLTRGMRRTLS